MSSVKQMIYTIQESENEESKLVIQLISTREEDFVISTIKCTKEWKENENELNIQKTFPFKVGQEISIKELEDFSKENAGAGEEVSYNFYFDGVEFKTKEDAL